MIYCSILPIQHLQKCTARCTKLVLQVILLNTNHSSNAKCVAYWLLIYGPTHHTATILVHIICLHCQINILKHTWRHTQGNCGCYTSSNSLFICVVVWLYMKSAANWSQSSRLISFDCFNITSLNSSLLSLLANNVIVKHPNLDFTFSTLFFAHYFTSKVALYHCAWTCSLFWSKCLWWCRRLFSFVPSYSTRPEWLITSSQGNMGYHQKRQAAASWLAC